MLGSVETKYEDPGIAEGHDCEGIGDLLEHSYNAVDFIEVGDEQVVVAKLVSEWKLLRSWQVRL